MTILWDWNGTLLSDVPLVVKINNEVFAHHGYRLTSEEEYRRIFRFPVKDYYTDIGVTDEDFPLVAKNGTKATSRTSIWHSCTRRRRRRFIASTTQASIRRLSPPVRWISCARRSSSFRS